MQEWNGFDQAAALGYSQERFQIKFLNMKILQWIVIVALLAGVAFLVIAKQKAESQVAQLRSENEQLAAEKATQEHEAENRATNENEEISRLRKETEELLRLRNEVRQLRDDKQQLTRQNQAAQTQAQEAQAQAQSAKAQAQALQANAALAAQAAAATSQLVPTGLVTQAAQDFRRRYGLDVTPQNACINNLRQIDGAKQQWALENRKPEGSMPAWADLSPYLRNQIPVCPSGGTYTLNVLSAVPTCTQPGHAIGK